MKKIRTIFLVVLCCMNGLLQSQSFAKYPQNFGPPMAGELLIIGTFCELRPNHFHGGLDIRTGSEIGKQLLAIGDGYVSRINISTVGYGKALYITHPNGYTSVYAHLSDFPETIKWYVEKNQYALQKWEVELKPDIDLLKVKKGELIAYSGNTGGSQGPHLHFEIRDTKTEEPINPLLFGFKMIDVLPPSISTIYLYQYDTFIKHSNGHFPSTSLQLFKTQIIKVKKKKKKILIPQTTFQIAFGKYAFGAIMKDIATSAGDNNGVNYIQVFMDNKLIYNCDLERFYYSQNRMYNNYTDYKKFKNGGTKAHKLFIDEGNTFDFYKNTLNNGWFDVKDTIPILFEIEVKDIYGNKSKKSITIVGSQEGIALKEYVNHYKNTKYCEAHKTNTTFIGTNFKFTLPASSLYHNYKLIYYQNYGNNYSIGDANIPLDKKMELSFKLTKEQLPLANKYVICSGLGKAFTTENTNDWITGFVKEFGTYYYMLDSLPPNIKPMSINKNGYFSFLVSDNLSGVADFDFYIDSQWVLLDYESKANLLFGKIPNPMLAGKHIIQLYVYDERKNVKIYTKEINIL